MSHAAAEFYVGELLLAPFGFAPDGFLPCDGRQLLIKDNVGLFSLIGTTYGGNGMTTFALPDLRGRVPVGQGGAWVLGQSDGTVTVTLTPSQLGQHTHGVLAAGSAALDTSPAGNVFAASPAHYQTAPNNYMNPSAVSYVGGAQPHPNMMPSMALNWLIAVQGIYPGPSGELMNSKGGK